MVSVHSRLAAPPRRTDGSRLKGLRARMGFWLIGLLLVSGCATQSQTQPGGDVPRDEPSGANGSPSSVAPAASESSRPADAVKAAKRADQPDPAAAAPRKIESSGPTEVVPPMDNENSVYFLLGSAALNDGARETIQRHATRLKADPRMKVTLVAHTDHLGSREYNVALGQMRASAVERELRAFGVPASQIRKRNYGNEKAQTCSTEQCKRTMRRVELRYPN